MYVSYPAANIDGFPNGNPNPMQLNITPVINGVSDHIDYVDNVIFSVKVGLGWAGNYGWRRLGINSVDIVDPSTSRLLGRFNTGFVVHAERGGNDLRQIDIPIVRLPFRANGNLIPIQIIMNWTNEGGSDTFSAGIFSAEQIFPVVDPNPTITSVSATQMIDGATWKLTAMATVADATSMQWEYSEDGGGIWDDIPGATTATAIWTHSSSWARDLKVRLRARNGNGTTTSESVKVTTYYAPTINGVATITPAAGPLTGSVILSADVITHGAPNVSYQWYCDDMPITGATAATYTHAFAGITTGDHTHHLVVTTAGGTISSNDLTYTAYAAPVFTSASIAPAEGIPPYTAVLSATATDAPTIQWFDTNDQPVTSPVTISSIGPASYYAVATGPGGTTRSEIVTTQGIDNPISLIQPATRFYVPAATIPFVVTGVETASWDFGDGSPAASSLQTTHAYAATGDYTVTVTSGIHNVSFVIHIGNAPAQPVITGPNVGTSGAETHMSVSSPESGVVYIWDTGDGTTGVEGSAMDHTYTTTNTATYTITVLATNPYGSITTTHYIEIAPPVTAEIVGGSEVYTTNQVVTVTAAVTGDNPTYTWSCGDWSASGRITTRDFGGLGDYIITLTIDNNHGHTSTASQTIHVGQAPGTITITGPDVGTYGQEITMSAANDGGEVDTWSWDFGDTTTATGNQQTHTYIAGAAAVAAVTVTVTAANRYGSSTRVYEIELAKPFDAVILRPNALSKHPMGTKIAFGVNTPTDTDLTNIVSYTWTMGDGSVRHGNAVDYAHTAIGTYTVTSTVDNMHGYTNSAAVTVEIGNPPTLTVISPKHGGMARIYREVTFSALTNDGSPINWDFGDSVTAEGATVTHTYDAGVSGDVIVTVSSTNDYGTTTTTLTLHIIVTTWAWESALGKKILFDDERFVLLRAGIDGMSGSTIDIVSSTAPQTVGELYQTVTYGRRTITFDILALGQNRAELEMRRTEILAAMSGYQGHGRLIWHRENGTVLYLNCILANGYPRFTDGTTPNAKQWPAEISLVAVDPCWYANDTITLTGDGTIVNPGDMPCPAVIILGKNGVTNTTSGEAITPATSAEGESYDLTGIIINTATGSKGAKDSGDNNVLYKIAISSKFVQIEPGENVISGAQSITIRPRWGGI